MGRGSFHLAVVLVVACLTGCSLFGKRKATQPPARDQARQGANDRTLLALGPNSGRDRPLPDPASMIPQPPSMAIPEIPDAPPKETEYVNAGDPPAKVIPTGGSREGLVKPAVATEPEANLDALRRLQRTAAEKFAAIDGFECRLTRRETIGSKAMPEEVLDYKFRREPFSLHIKWVGMEGQGRELVYVQGKSEGKVHVLTGRGDGLLVPSGKRFAFAPTDNQIRSKSRFDIREGGMAMSITWFGKVVSAMEKDPKQASRMRYLGVKPRRERESGLEAVEETIPPDWEPLLPKGGRRTTYFDPDPKSPSHGLPILVIAFGDTGREVEYYWFEQLRPIKPKDAEFDPERLWRTR